MSRRHCGNGRWIDRGDADFRLSAAGLAVATQAESAGSGAGGRGLGTPHQLHRDRAVGSQPRDGVLRLAAALDVCTREQNRLPLAAGLAPVYAERSLDDPDMSAIRDGVGLVLAGYDPYPCLAVDRLWNIVSSNSGTAVLIDGVAPYLLDNPKALRIALHPDGLARRIRNLARWRHHVIGRLRREVAAGGSDRLALQPGRATTDVFRHRDHLRYGTGPHRRRTQYRGVSTRRRGDRRGSALTDPRFRRTRLEHVPFRALLALHHVVRCVTNASAEPAPRLRFSPIPPADGAESSCSRTPYA